MLRIGGGVREMVNVERMKELIEPYYHLDAPLSEDPYTSVSLRNKSYSHDAARELHAFLATLPRPHLVVADLADMIAGRPEEEALKVLSYICDGLKGHRWLEIDLSDNALGMKGLKACMSVLSNQPQLERLYFCNNGLSASAATLIANDIVLHQGSNVPTCLKVFHFYNNMSGNDGAIALATILPACPALMDLRFSATRAGRTGCLAFATHLHQCTRLVHLDLSDNTFGVEGAKALRPALTACRALKTLNVRDAALQDEGALHVLQALTGAHRLQRLDMSGNDISPDGMQAILPTLHQASTTWGQAITHLCWEDNEIGTSGASGLAQVLPTWPKLTHLTLNVNEIQTKGGMALITAITHDSALTRLELDGNQFSTIGIDTMKTHLMRVQKPDLLGSLDDNDELEEEDHDWIAHFQTIKIEN